MEKTQIKKPASKKVITKQITKKEVKQDKTNKLLDEAIADAKQVQKVAIANAKKSLADIFEPRIQAIFQEKIRKEVENADGEDVENDEEETEDTDLDIDTDEEEMTEEDETNEDEEEMTEEDETSEDEIDLDIDTDEEEMTEEDEASEDEIDLDLDDEEEMTEEDETSEDEIDLDLDDEEEMTEEDEMETGDDEDFDLELDDDEEEMTEEDESNEDDTDIDSMIDNMDDEDLNDEDDVTEEIVNENKSLKLRNKKLESKLKEAYKTILFIKKELNETNLLNAKLHYAQKVIGSNKELSEQQKQRVIEKFDNAKNLREVKLIYSTLIESVKKQKPTKQVNKLTEGIRKGIASKTTGNTRVNKEVITESNEIVNRLQQLAKIQ